MDEVVQSIMSEYKLFRESDIRNAGKLKDGPWTLSYMSPSDKLNAFFSANNNDDLHKSFTPIVINNNGEIESGKTPSESITSGLAMFDSMLFKPIHEVTEGVISGELGLYHPFTRWFNEGVANWVMIKVTGEFAPQCYKELCSKSMPHPNDPLRKKINLISWVQGAYQKQSPSEEESNISNNSYDYATEAISRMLDNQPPDALAKILQKLKGKNNPYTDVILAVLHEVTGKDAWNILRDYVPSDVLPLFRQGSMEELSSQAEKLAEQNKYNEVLMIFKRLLETFPYDTNARLDYAWALRKTKQPKEEFERQIRIAGECLQNGNVNLSLIKEDADMHFILGRLMETNKTKDQSKEEYTEALKLDPNHADAKAALDAINKTSTLTNQ
jgi:tetratricopeptide (TPR) repeat protein